MPFAVTTATGARGQRPGLDNSGRVAASIYPARRFSPAFQQLRPWCDTRAVVGLEITTANRALQKDSAASVGYLSTMVFGIDLPEMKMPDMPGMDLVPGVKEKDPPGEALTPVVEAAIKFCATKGKACWHSCASPSTDPESRPQQARGVSFRSQPQTRLWKRRGTMPRQAPAPTHWLRHRWC